MSRAPPRRGARREGDPSPDLRVRFSCRFGTVRSSPVRARTTTEPRLGCSSPPTATTEAAASVASRRPNREPELSGPRPWEFARRERAPAGQNCSRDARPGRSDSRGRSIATKGASVSSTPAAETRRPDEPASIAALPEVPPQHSISESVLDNLPAWTVVAAAGFRLLPRPVAHAEAALGRKARDRPGVRVHARTPDPDHGPDMGRDRRPTRCTWHGRSPRLRARDVRRRPDACNDVVLSQSPVYEPYSGASERLFGMSALEDQAAAGFLMMLEQMLVLGTAAVFLVRRHLDESSDAAAAAVEHPAHPFVA